MCKENEKKLNSKTNLDENLSNKEKSNLNTNKMDLTKKISIGNFTEIYRCSVPFFNGVGIFLRHTSGLEVFHVLNDSKENLFSFCFKTVPSDSTGVAHILEHSVLGGSKNYPLKDPFLVLSNQSVKTYLNAMTFPTKTIYPASTTVEADYFNLMAVYGDAVFFPLLSKNTFMQEGYRLEFNSDGKLVTQGVVYNEMKGNYSSSDSLINDCCMNSILKGTPFQFDSGGNPEEIPNLTYEQFCDFYKKNYTPANCRIFLYGNIPTEKQLEFIESKFLSKISFYKKNFEQQYSKNTESTNDTLKTVNSTKGNNSIKQYSRINLTVPGNDEEGYTAFLNWKLPVLPAKKRQALYFLLSVLLFHDGSPLRKALVESKLGLELAPGSGLESRTEPPFFSIGLKGIKKSENIEKFKDLVFQTLKAIINTGIDKDELQAMFSKVEFARRDVSSGTTAVILSAMEEFYSFWDDEKSPRDYVKLYCEQSEYLLNEVIPNQKMLTDFIQDVLIDNLEYNLVVAKHEKDYEKVLEEKFSLFAKNKEKTLSQKEKKEIKKAQKQLVKIQSKTDSKKLVKLIPHINVSDLNSKLENTTFTTEKIGNVSCFFENQPTNGVAFIKIYVPVENIPESDYAFLSAFAEIFADLGFGEFSWSEASQKQMLYTNGISSSVSSFDTVPNADFSNPLVGRDLFILSTRILNEYLAEGLDLLFCVFLSPNFSDGNRIKNILLDSKETLQSALMSSGHIATYYRACSHFSRSKAVSELWDGAESLINYKNYCELQPDELTKKCETVFSKLKENGCFVNCTADLKTLEKIKPLLEKNLKAFNEFLPRPQNLVCPKFSNGLIPVSFEKIPTLECMVFPSQVSYSALVFKGIDFSSPLSATQKVLAYWLEKNILWEEIRMKGGSYGVFARSGNIYPYLTMLSYRDPNPLETLRRMKKSLYKVNHSIITQQSLDKSITGCYSREVVPRSPAEKGQEALSDFLQGYSFDEKQAFFDKMLSTNVKQIKQVSEVLMDSIDESFGVIACNKKIAEFAEKKINSVQILNLML